jgi:hypothetical protein
MENLLINLVFLNTFVGNVEMWQGFPNQNNILFHTIISFICSLISQHNARLVYEPSSFTKF